MTKFLTLIVSGGVSGAMFAIMASGLVLTFGTSGTFNLAHGAIAFVVSYVFFQLHTGQGIAVVPAAILSVLVFAPLLGLALDRILFRRLATAPVHARIVGTVGLLVALPNLALFIVDELNAHGGSFPEVPFGASPGLGPVPSRVYHLSSGLVINSDQVIVLGVSAVAAGVLWFVIRRTRLGLTMRADVDCRELSALRGVNTARVSAASWVLSTVLAGLGGVLLSPFFGVEPGTYTLVVLGSIAAVVVAGLRSLPLALAGGVALGIVQNLVAGYSDVLLPDVLADLGGLRSSVPFVATVVGLVVLGRRRGRTAGTRSSEAPPPDHRAGMSAARRLGPWLVFTVLLLGYVVFVADDFWAFLVAKGLVIATIFLSFVVVTGMGGMVSLSQATFVTAGGFAAGWLMNHQFAQTVPVLMTNGRVNFLVAALAGAGVAMLLGAIIALPVRRLSALPLALATLSLAFVADLLIFQVDSIRGGSSGYLMRPPSIGPLDFADRQSMAVLAFAVFGILALAVISLQKSATGRAMYAARSSEVAARAAGLSPERTRTLVFVVSAAIAGIGGAMFGVVSGGISNTSAPPTVGLIWLAIVVTWGARRPAGALVAGLIFGVGNDLLLRVTDWNATLNELAGSSRFLPILFGLGAIQLAMDPDGVLSLMAHQRAGMRAAIARHRASPEDTPAESSTTTPATVARTGDHVLTLHGVRSGYGEIEVLHGVDLELRPGRITALLGPNGAGKSTLCATIAGLLPATGGRILHRGADLTGAPAYERTRAGVFIVPENRGIFPGLSVDENLSVWLPSSEDRQRAYERFPALATRRRQAAGLLSGGEQQMLSLASPLVRHPDLLIVDEPTLGLAPLAAGIVRETLGELRNAGVSILLVEEKTQFALDLADDVAVMALGRVVWRGRADEIDDVSLADAYFGEDPAFALASATAGIAG